MTTVKHENDNKKVSIAILESKLEQTERKIKEQEEIAVKVSLSMPVVTCTSQNDSEKFDFCKKKLADFYREKLHRESQEPRNVQKTIDGSLKTLTNATIFENIMKAMQNYQKEIEVLETDLKHDNDGNLYISLTMQLITQLNYELACRGIKTIELKKKIAHAKELCNENVENFSKKVIACFTQYDIDFIEDEEEISDHLEEFLGAVIGNLRAQGANKRAKEMLDNMNSTDTIEMKTDQFAAVRLHNNEIMNLISSELTKFEENHGQMLKILEKINLLKLSTRQKIFDIQSNNQMVELSRTMAGVLKIDDEKTELRSNEREFSTFLTVSIDQLKSPSLHSNLTESLPVETVELMSKTNCDTTSINKFIDSMVKLIEIHQKFMDISRIREPNIKIVDEKSSIEQIEEQVELNRDAISELIDKITFVNDDIKNQLRDCRRLYDHMLTNPLVAFVPPSKTLEGKTYAEYEKDIKMYMRAIKN